MSPRLSINKIATQLVGLIGRKLTAYVGGVRDVRAVDRWMEGREVYGDGEQRLRFVYQLVKMLAETEDPRVIQAWLTGLNPEFGDRVPIRLMRETIWRRSRQKSWGPLGLSSLVDRSILMGLESKRPSRPLFRMGRAKDAWAVPDWAHAKGGTFENRFDDPNGLYRVL